MNTKKVNSRVHSLVSEKYDLSQCPHCGSINIKNFIHEQKTWRIFPTMLCLDCRYEWLPRNKDKKKGEVNVRKQFSGHF